MPQFGSTHVDGPLGHRARNLLSGGEGSSTARKAALVDGAQALVAGAWGIRVGASADWCIGWHDPSPLSATRNQWLDGWGWTAWVSGAVRPAVSAVRVRASECSLEDCHVARTQIDAAYRKALAKADR